MALGASTRFIDNETDLDAAGLNTLDGGANVYHSPNGGLNYRVTAGSIWLAGGRFDYAGAASDQAVNPSVTTYVFLDQAGALASNETGFPVTPHVPLAQVVSSGSAITSIVDRRPRLALPGAAPTRLWRAGFYYTDGPPPAGTNLALTADTLYGVPFIVQRAQAVDRIAVEVTTLSAASSVRLGLYAESASVRGEPGALLEDLGTISGGTTGIKALTISPTRQLAAGVFFVAVVASDGTVAFRAHTQADKGGSFGWPGAAADFTAGETHAMWRGANGGNPAASALPATFPSTPTSVDSDQVAAFLRAA